MMRASQAGALAVVLAMFVGGCGDSPEQPKPGQQAPANPGGEPPAPQGPAAAVPRAAPGAATAAPIPSDLPPLPVRDIQEKDFAESPSNRDPFRSYADAFKTQSATKKVTVQREVLSTATRSTR